MAARAAAHGFYSFWNTAMDETRLVLVLSNVGLWENKTDEVSPASQIPEFLLCHSAHDTAGISDGIDIQGDVKIPVNTVSSGDDVNAALRQLPFGRAYCG
jgi:hypothetical protein